MSVNILGYGVYIPRYRIAYEETRKAWENLQYLLGTGPRLGVMEKAVPHYDEDSITMAVEAGKNAVRCAGIDIGELGALIMGSATPPYQNRDSSSTVAAALYMRKDIVNMDLNQASRSGTSALRAAEAIVESGMAKYALVIASDLCRPEPGTELEPTLSAGAGALVLGKEEGIAEIEDRYSFSSETFDMWAEAHEELLRYDDSVYRLHFLNAITESGKGLLEKMGLKASDYKYAVFNQPNARREPIRVGRALNFTLEQIEAGVVASKVGDAHCASPFIGLAKVLDEAEGGDRIFLASYGSGGSDAFSLRTKPKISGLKRPSLVKDYLEDKININYSMYLKFLRLVHLRRPQDELLPSTWEILRLNPVRFRPQYWECAKCGYLSTSLQKVCPKCHSQQWKGPFPLPEKGKIYSFTEGTVAPGPNWEQEVRDRYAVALVEFGDGKRVVAKVVDYDGVELDIGTDVEMVFRKYQSLPVNIYSYKFRPPLKRA